MVTKLTLAWVSLVFTVNLYSSIWKSFTSLTSIFFSSWLAFISLILSCSAFSAAFSCAWTGWGLGTTVWVWPCGRNFFYKKWLDCRILIMIFFYKNKRCPTLCINTLSWVRSQTYKRRIQCLYGFPYEKGSVFPFYECNKMRLKYHFKKMDHKNMLILSSGILIPLSSVVIIAMVPQHYKL